MLPLDQPVFLFDGDCGVCQNGTDRMRRRFNPPVALVPYQSVDLARYDVSESEALEGPVLVRADGSHVIGPAAMAGVLRMSRSPYRQVGSIMGLRGVRSLLARVGPVLYRNRGRIPGTAGTCEVAPRVSSGYVS